MNHSLFFRRPLILTAMLVAVLGLVFAGAGCAPAQQSQDAAEMQESNFPFGNPPQPGEMKTLAVIGVNRYERVMGDVGFLGSLADMANVDQIFEAMILQFVQDRGLAAIDKTKPWGVVVQTDGVSFPILAFLPVSRPDDLLAAAEANGIQINRQEDGQLLLMVPNGPPLFVKAEGGWAIVAQSPDALAHVPATFEADLKQVAGDYDIAATFFMQQVPEPYRQLFTQSMRSGMEASLQRQPGESDEQFQFRREMAEMQLGQVEQLFEELEELSVGFAVDAPEERVYLDFVIKATSGSTLGKQLAAYREARTNFAGFYQPDAAATFTFANQVDPALMQEDLATMRSSMDALRQQLDNALDQGDDIPQSIRAGIKDSAGDFIEALVGTIETGKMDGGAALHLGPEELTCIAGVRIMDTNKVLEGLKKLEASIKQEEPNFPGVAWNAEEHAGVSFHTLSVPLPPSADEPVRRMIGEALDIAVGTGPEAVYLAVGRDNLEAIKRAIDASQAEPNKLVPPAELAVSLGPIMELAAAWAPADDRDSATIQNIVTMLRNDARGRDHIRFVGQLVPNGFRYRFELEAGVLRAIGRAIQIAQMRAMGM